MASPLVGIGAVNALLFAAYSRLKAILATFPNEQLALYKIAIAGAGAGMKFFIELYNLVMCANPK